MEDVNKLLKTAVDDIERVLNSKTVIGDPISVEGATIIPLVSIGFGFGAGGGSTKPTGDKENVAGATGAGGGVKPVAVV
ncbi:MAG: spore germination protein GerW family protein, partial [Thermodesulfobacteriota bacterium]